MRKFTYALLSIALSLVCSSAWAAVGAGQVLTSLDDLDNTEAFTFYASEERGSLIAVGDGVYSTVFQNIEFDANSTAQQFALVKYNGDYFLYNVQAQKFMKKGEDVEAVLSDIGDAVRLVYVNDGNYWQIYFGDDRLNLGDGGGMNINGYGADGGANDAGNRFKITSVGNASKSVTAALALLANTQKVTFNTTFDGALIDSYTKYVAIGYKPEIPKELNHDYCTYRIDVPEVTAQTNTVNIIGVFDGPFTISPSVNDAVWYFLKINGKYTVSDATGSECKDVASRDVTVYGQWAFVGNPYTGFKIYNRGLGSSYTLQNKDGDEPKVQVLPDAETAYLNIWNIQKNGDTFLLYTSDGNYLNDHGARSALTIWEAGSSLVAEAVPLTPLTTVTYNVSFGGEVVATATASQFVGEAPELPNSLRLEGLCNYTFTSENPVVDKAIYEVKAEWVGPFTFSADYASATWKNLTVNGKYVNYAATEPYPNVAAPSAASRASDAYLWAFLGNPYNLVVINKKAGAGYSLALGGTGDGATVVLRKGVTGHKVVPSQTGFAIVTTEGPVNDFGGFLKVWKVEGNGGDGSRMYVVDAPDPDYALSVAEDVTPWMESAGEVFGLKQSVYDSNKVKYEAALKSCDKATYDELIEAVTAPKSLNVPADGFYRIYNTMDRFKVGRGYIGVRGDGQTSANIVAGAATDEDILVNPEWAATVVRVENVEDGFTLSIEGQYLQAPNSNAYNVPLGDEPVVYTYELVAPGLVKMVSTTNDEVLHRGMIAETDFIGWREDGPSDFRFEVAETIEVPLTPLAGKNYATLVVPFDVTLGNDGTKAYTISLDGKGLARPVALTVGAKRANAYARGMLMDNPTIPAGTPVLLENETAATASLSIGEGYAATPSAEGALIGGYLAEVSAPESALELGVNEQGELGFFNHPAVGYANTAYFIGNPQVLDLTTPTDETTGVSQTTVSTDAVEAIYSADGSQQDRLKAGLNLVRKTTADGSIKVVKILVK